MPGHKRIDVPGAVHHIIARGLNRQDIFLGDKDRIDFLDRLETALSQTGSKCYAWALLKTTIFTFSSVPATSLSDLMRKVLFGYAIAFNHRHGRHGYLFQNRYKSILCQEEGYLLELMRYIHSVILAIAASASPARNWPGISP